MGLIKSHHCTLAADSNDADMTRYLWPIVREIIKTCIENEQNIIIEGCYIPFTWKDDFSDEQRKIIKYICLIFSKNYINNHLPDILTFENVIEKRLSSDITIEEMIKTNIYNLQQCIIYKHNYILIDDNYQINIDGI